jgi:hypothetical protein
MNLDIFRYSLLIFILSLVIACDGGDDNIVDNRPSNSAGFCDVKLKDFSLDNSNTTLRAYDMLNQVSFINEDGQTLVFTIGPSIKSRFEGIFEVNDTFNICYAKESIETKLKTTDGIEITFQAEPKAYFAELEDALYADVMKIYYNDTNDVANERRIVFRKVLNMNSYPPPLYQTTQNIGSQFFIDREFENIELTQFNTPIIVLYYNTEIGIVAFIDESGVLWQFDSKS